VQQRVKIATSAGTSDVAEATAQSASGPPREGALSRHRRQIVPTAAAGVSLALHAGALVAAIGWLERNQRQGATLQPSDAISVELVVSTALDALQPDQLAKPAAAPEATAPVKGSSEPSQTPTPKLEPVPERETTDKSSVAAPNSDERETRAAEAGDPKDEPVPTVPPDAQADAVREPPKAPAVGEAARAKARQVEKKKPMRRIQEGGATSKATAATGSASTRVTASPGSILAYADSVRARVAANRPTGTSFGGTAHIAFGLTPSGGLAYLRIARSSGNAANDAVALAAVRGAAPFPPAPAGATPHQLQFTIPYYFQ
jgi:periplasmic protein TonB